jgi:hypothetical protein
MSDYIFVGPEVGVANHVEIPVFHMAITGQTQLSGKTTAIKTLAVRAVDLGYKILIFDTKETGREYAGFGDEIPACMRETTDSFILIGLLESIFQRRLTRYYATLDRLAEGVGSFDDVIERGKELEQRTRSPFLKDAARVLYKLMERLRYETAKVETVEELQMPYEINRMGINQFSKEAQQLIVRNAFEDLLRKYNRKTIPMLDEAFKFIPQRYSSACTETVQRVITQGAKTGLYVWIATQFLAPTDKDPLKACAVRILGTQDHPTEVKHTMDLIPFKGFTKEDVMKLPLGHFIVVTKKFAKLTYLLPQGVPRSMGRKVATRELTPEYIRDQILSRLRKEEEDDEVWRQKCERLEARIKEVEGEKKRLQEKLEKAPKAEPKPVQRLKEELMQLKTSHRSLIESEHALKEKVTKLGTENTSLKGEIEAFQCFKEALAKILPTQPMSAPRFESKTEPTLSEAQLLAMVDARVKRRLVEVREMKVVEVDVGDRIKELVKDDYVERLVQRLNALPEVAKKAARWLHQKKEVKIGDLYYQFYQKTGRIPGAFYINVVNPLEEAWLIKNEAGNIRWVLEERLQVELKHIVSEGDVHSMRDYLLSLLL